MPELPPVPKGSNRDIPVSVQELVYGGKAEGVGTSAKSLHKHNEFLSSSEEFHGPRKDRRTSEGLDTHVLQETSPTDTSLVQKLKHVVRGPQEEVGPRKGQQHNGSSPSLHKCQTRRSTFQRAIRRGIKRQRKRKNASRTSLTHRIIEFPRRIRQPWTMCSIWQDL
ncbi:hypothetical protein O181_032015 [Austropuccinia psidii MF-1]|uniref:Uncharacterized protein n=1 Tax=Austropuccinia psidii MF-1 TaxID=1389203 RepID=A0A9Q3CYY5_9BASI|nr:hypothetical protein [Austropuccinia psidii MF-1]